MRGLGYAAVSTAVAAALVYGCSELVTPDASNSAQHPAPAQPRKAAVGAALTGQWTPAFSWPIVAVHMSVLPDGRFLSWTSNAMDYAGNTPNVYLWNPANPGAFVQVPEAYTDIFCSAHTFLSDGRLFVAGGHLADGIGSKDGNLFDPQTSSWSQLPQMRAGRWYPSTVILGDGEIGIASGQDQNGQYNPIPEIWDGTQYRALNGAPQTLPWYPWLHVAPDGRVFYAGPEPQTRFLNPSGDGEWTNAGRHVNSTTRDFGTSVLYAPGKLIVLGGGSTPVNTAELVDLNVGTTWTSTSSMQYARRQLNALVLADGKVLVVGGTSAPGFNTESGSILTPELWDPATGLWTAMSDMAIQRDYHSTAVLMPDARVLSAGGGRCGGCLVNHMDAQIFSPPYLFNPDGSAATRPTITSAPTTLNRGQVFTVTTPDYARITRATLARLPSTSHAFNMNQAFVSLPATQVSGGVQLTAPPNPNLMPAGHYELFLLDGNGVPSVAKIVQLLGTAPLPAPPAVPSAPSGLAANQVSSTQVNLTWTDNSTSESSFRIERCQGAGCASFAEIGFVAANVTAYSDMGLTAGTPYTYRVRAMNAAGGSSYTNVVSLGGPNNPPVASFTWSCPTLTCTFDATTSTDDNGIVSYTWDLNKYPGGTATGPIVSTTYPHSGTRNVTLTVTDAGGLSSSVTQTITLGSTPPPNQPPVAAFSSNCTNLACTFDSSGSTDDVGITNRAWTFGDGSSAGNVVAPNHSYASAGTYSVTLTVYDAGGLFNSVTKQVTVTAAPPPPPVDLPPTARFTYNCAGLNLHQCAFDASTSSDDIGIVSYKWDWGNGRSETHATPTARNTWASAGTYTVTLTVTDTKGQQNSTSKSVAVP